MEIKRTRGVIVIGKSFFSEDGTTLDLSEGIDDRSLRKYLTYWDEIHHVGSSLFGGLDLKDENYSVLLQEKILKSVIVNFPKEVDTWSPYGMASKEIAQMDYYKKLSASKDSNMIFSVAQTGNMMKLYSESDEQVPCLELSLQLPYLHNTPVEHILEFKAKRKDELLNFRIGLDELIKKAGPELSSDALIKVTERIARNVNDISRVMDETKFQKILTSVRTYLNLEDSKTMGIILSSLGIFTSNRLNVPPEIGALGGLALNAGINLAIKKENKIEGLPLETRDFAYLYYVEKANKR